MADRTRTQDLAARLDQPRDTRRRLSRPDTDRLGRFAEAFARFMGTARFLIWMTAFILAWVAWNSSWGPDRWRWDEYPFIFLTLMLSLQASYAAPLILLAQNRQESRDRVQYERDRRADAQSHADMQFLTREVAGLRLSLGEVATRDFIRGELRELLETLEPEPEQESEPEESAQSTSEPPT